MIRRFSVAMAVVAVLGMGAVATASASTPEFATNGPGKLSSENVSNQVFTANGIVAECHSLEILEGEAKAFYFNPAKVTIKYKQCKAAGVVRLKPIVASFDFQADGTVEITKPITIESEEEGVCKIAVPAQTAGSSIAYKNVVDAEGHSAVEMLPAMTSIESSGTGGDCTYAPESKGSYRGPWAMFIPGANLEWLA